MRRFSAVWIALCLLFGAGALAEGAEKQEDLRGNGIVIIRNKEVLEDEKQKQAIDYPTFEGEDEALAAYLTKQVTEPFLALRKLGQMADDDAYEDGSKDFIRSGYFASMDFPGVLSIEMTVTNRAARESAAETLFFYQLIDLAGQKTLSLYDLFDAAPADVDQAIREEVYAFTQNSAGAVEEQIPPADSYFLLKDALRCIFGAGKINEEAIFVDIPWESLGLLKAPILTGGEGELLEETGEVEEAEAEARAMVEAGEPLEELEVLLDSLMANDWAYDGGSAGLRFGEDGALTNPSGSFAEYYIDDGFLVLVGADGAESRALVTKQGTGLLLTFTQSVDGYDMLTLTPSGGVEEEAQVAPMQAQPQADFSLAPVQTSTPMPVSGDDVPVLDLLTRGLWKQMGTDGSTYYQFMPDGKLLVINVEEYAVKDGRLESDSLAGKVIMGGDTAFTLEQSGQLTGYVLNRSAETVSGAEFVTPSPTPVVTPTPEPTPTPTMAPTEPPTPTPEPTPTLSPYEIARKEAPSLAALGDASFDKVKTLKVYSAPSNDAYREDQWQVTTDDEVGIYGVEGDWLLVSYTIGNGSKGRMGYVETSTLSDPEKVAKLGFAAVKITLTKDASATDDPLQAKGRVVTLKKGNEVKLLAFLGADWAYVETTYKNKTCRLFIPQSSLMSE